MKVALLLLIAGCFAAANRKKLAPSPATGPAEEQNAALTKAPDCDKPEQFLWQIMFGNQAVHSTFVRFCAAIIFIAAQIALEILKSK